MARPLNYPNEDEIVRLAQEYISSTGREQTSLPTIEGLALHLDLDDETITEYAKIYPKFSATVKRVKALQKNQLMEDGMYGGKEVNQAMAIFLLKANHGMVEKSALDLTSGGKPLTGPVIYTPEKNKQ